MSQFFISPTGSDQNAGTSEAQAEGDESIRCIAESFGMDPKPIGRIVRGQAWKHVQEDEVG